MRSGWLKDGCTPGVFAFGTANGNVNSLHSFRVVLVTIFVHRLNEKEFLKIEIKTIEESKKYE